MNDQSPYMYPAPATEALELFMTSHVHHHRDARKNGNCDDGKLLHRDGPNQTQGMKRTPSAIISPCSSADSLEKLQQGLGRRRGGSIVEEPLDLSALVRATVPVENSVAFPAIEWNSDYDDDDDDEGGGENDVGGDEGCHLPLDTAIGAPDDSDDVDDDEELLSDGETTTVRPTKSKRSGGGGYATHLPRSKSRKLCLAGLGPSSPSSSRGAGLAGMGRAFGLAAAAYRNLPSVSLDSASSWPPMAPAEAGEDRGSNSTSASAALAAVLGSVTAGGDDFFTLSSSSSPPSPWGQFVTSDPESGPMQHRPLRQQQRQIRRGSLRRLKRSNSFGSNNPNPSLKATSGPLAGYSMPCSLSC